MANIKSSKKRAVISQKRYERNKAYRSALRTAIKKADMAIENKADNMGEVVRLAVKAIDKASAKGLIHKNNAARRKSSLTLRLKKANA